MKQMQRQAIKKNLIHHLSTLFYPPQCITCDELIDDTYGLCPACWARTPFIVDEPCDCCGRPMLGEVEIGDLCDDCLVSPQPWDRGRSALLYEENARAIVLKLKHGDRTDLAFAAGEWLARAARPLVCDKTLVAPVPLHWMRAVRRRYNQSELLGRRAAKLMDLDFRSDLLRRPVPTRPLKGMTFDQRRDMVSGAIAIAKRHATTIKGRHILLVDDVMTTGATMNQCAKTCLEAGAERVSVVVLARVAKKT